MEVFQMPDNQQPHVHKKRQNPLELKKEPIKKKTVFNHNFLYEKTSFLELIKSKTIHFNALNKDIMQSLKIISSNEKLSNLIEDAILVYIATHNPSEYDNLLKLLKLRGDEQL
jgi:hypothetical protein